MALPVARAIVLEEVGIPVTRACCLTQLVFKLTNCQSENTYTAEKPLNPRLFEVLDYKHVLLITERHAGMIYDFSVSIKSDVYWRGGGASTARTEMGESGKQTLNNKRRVRV